jgi:tetratricopeptide (TPR) repeat protein
MKIMRHFFTTISLSLLVFVISLQAQSEPQDPTRAFRRDVFSENYGNSDVDDRDMLYGEAGDTLRLELDLRVGRSAYVIIQSSDGVEVLRKTVTVMGLYEETVTLPNTGLYTIFYGLERDSQSYSYLDNQCFNYCLSSGNSADCSEQCTFSSEQATQGRMRIELHIVSDGTSILPEKPVLPANASIAEYETFIKQVVWMAVFSKDDLLELLNNLLEVDANNGVALGYRADIYRRFGDTDLARADIETALALNANNPTALAVQAQLLLVDNNIAGAQTLVTQALSADRNDIPVLFAQARIYELQRDPDSARQFYDRAIAQNPNIDEPYYLRSRLSREKEVRLPDLVLALQIDPYQARNNATLGDVVIQNLQPAYGLKLAQRAIKISETYAFAYYVEGYAYNAFDRHTEAVVSFSRAIEINPDYTLAYRERGYTYYYLEQYEDAVADFTQALSLDPDDLNLLSERAMVYQAMGNYADALLDGNRLVELYPDNYGGYGIRAEALFGQGKRTEAQSECRTAQRIASWFSIEGLC